MPRTSTRRILLLIVILVFSALTLTGCFERNVETRAKMEQAREKINNYQELSDFGDYNKYRDKQFRDRFMQKVEEKRSERRISRAATQAMQDGSLMESYQGGRKKTRRQSQSLP